MKEQLPLRGPCRFLSPTLTVVLLTFVVVGCRPDLPHPGSNALATDNAREFVVRLEPDASLDAAPRVLRAHVQWPNPIDKDRVFLIRGEVTDYHLKQIERDDLTKTLVERMVPAIVWAEDEQNVVIAPTVALDPGQTYAIASGEPSRVKHFVVRKDGELPLFDRIWPPFDEPGGFGIFCGGIDIPDAVMDVQLDPLGPLGVLSRGIAANGPGRRCLRFQNQGRERPAAGDSWVLPPLVEMPGPSGIVVQLEPAMASPAEAIGEMVPLECDSDEVMFGPGCAVVMDDRISVRAPAGELLWGIAGGGIDKIAKTASKERFVIKGFSPDTEVTLDVVTVDPFGRTHRENFTATTKSLSAHIVLNEVLANPNGPEPQQEWVELYNDGKVETSLAGYHILDIGGDTVLPDVLLPAGQFAVLVNESYVEDDEVDVLPASDAILVRIAALGKSGLSNSGELLRLVDPEGHTISRFSAFPKPKAGQSVSRATPDASDGVSSSFVITEPTPGKRNTVMAEP